MISHDRLLALGLCDPSSAAPTPTAPTSTSTSGHRFIVPAGVKPRPLRAKSKASAPIASALAAPITPSTTRTSALLNGLARDENERGALLQVLEPLLEDLARAPEPFTSLLFLSRLCDAIPNRAEFFAQLRDEPAFRARLLRLGSWSQALADAVIREPALLSLIHSGAHPVSRPTLRAQVLEALRDCASRTERLDTLRALRRREFVRIGLLDLDRDTWRDEADFDLVVRQISDLAQVMVSATLQVLASSAKGFCVVIMGKGGARELNYSSDLDLIFLHENNPAADALGAELLRELNAQTSAGWLYRVDMRLRPEGRNGPLVTPLGYALSYYESFAAPWEWQALIKARVIAGDAHLGRRFRHFTRGVTWARRADDEHLRAIVAMKKRSEETSDGSDERNLKSGPGGIRDAEWIVQQLQMMLGPTHPRARAKPTLRALQVLEELSAISFEEANQLREGYLFARVAEHRLQIWAEQAVRILPEAPRDKAALARRLGCTLRGEAGARWLDEVHSRHQNEIRELCRKMFWGWRESQAHDAPLLPPSLHNPDVLARLKRLGEGTELHPLPSPLSRQIRAALPGALKYLEVASAPERALANLERLCEASGNRLSLLRSLSDSPDLARAIYTLLGGAKELGETLIRCPELLDMAASRPLLTRAKGWEEVRSDCRSYCLVFRDRRAALRRWKSREMLRIALRDLAVDASPLEVTREISDVCRASLELATEECGRDLQPASSRFGFAVLGMGKLGGGEMHPASDADVLWVHEAFDGYEGASEVASRWALDVGKYLSERLDDGEVFEVDARLRPEGRNGALAPSLEGYRQYFERASGGLAVWERQALTRARFMAGDARTGAALLALIRHVAFPAEWRGEWSDELRHIKQRVENERATSSRRGEAYDVKLGHGTLSDIEWVAQWTALKHGAAHIELQTPNTLRSLQAAAQVQVLAAQNVAVLGAAYEFFRRAEIRLHTALDVKGSALPAHSPEWKAWARAVFPNREDAEDAFAGSWSEHSRGVREVFEEVREGL